MTTATNNIEIRILGQMRSGNHAFVDWLYELYPDRLICFLNNVRHGDHDPFESYTQLHVRGIDDSLDATSIRHIDKDVLIYSYEDRMSLELDNVDFLSSVFNKDFERKREFYLGQSRLRFDIIIIRDPFNCLASRLVQLRNRGGLGGLENMKLIRDNWKVVATRVASIKNQASTHEIVVNYNKWIRDETYQEELSKSLMGEFSRKSVDDIPFFGGGSSFERTNISRRLTGKDLISKWRKFFSLKRWLRLHSYFNRVFVPNRPDEFLRRWQLLANDPEYRELFVDREVLELSERIFGEIPGTREFVKDVQCIYSPSS